MDRRQRKTRDAIFYAFAKLLSQMDYNQITVGQIIDLADVGRATFYAHFETKDFLLKDFCGELFCHIFDAESSNEPGHHHIFDCDSSESVFVHLFRHLQKNDNNILRLLSCQNNQLFWGYFRSNLEDLIEDQLPLFASKQPKQIPCPFWKNHITSTLVETIKWWVANGLQESPELITDYFMRII